MFPCAMSAGIVSAEARIVRLHLSEAYHGAPERLLFLSLIFVIFACLSFSSFCFFLQLFNFFLFVFLYSLSILKISFLFLVISIVRPQSCFYRFFLAIFVKPLQRPEVRQLHLLHMRSSARNAYIRPFVHPCDVLKRTFSAPSVASFVTERYLDVCLGKTTARKYKR